MTLVQEIGKDDVSGLAAEMAYRFLFAMFPFFIFLAALLGFIGAWVGQANLFDSVMAFIGNVLPAQIQEILADSVRAVVTTQSTQLLTLGVLGALWGAAGGVGTLSKGLNRAYDVTEDRPFWKAQLIALGMTLALAFGLLFGSTLIAFGGWLGRTLAENFGLSQQFVETWNRATAPLVGIGLWLILVTMYAVLPNQRIQVRHALPGALCATIAWIALTLGFGVYLSHFGNFNKTFGSLATPVVLMFWMYAVGMILLIGGEINAIIGGQKREQLEQDGQGSPSTASTG
jgi:membrane protein